LGSSARREAIRKPWRTPKSSTGSNSGQPTWEINFRRSAVELLVSHRAHQRLERRPRHFRLQLAGAAACNHSAHHAALLGEALFARGYHDLLLCGKVTDYFDRFTRDK
jgi:hypothetical protein